LELYPEDSEIISMDNYYKGHKFMKKNPKINFDEPKALNVDLFVEHLKELKT
jgi:uridine kinase